MHTHCEASPDSRTPIAEQARGVRAARRVAKRFRFETRALRAQDALREGPRFGDVDQDALLTVADDVEHAPRGEGDNGSPRCEGLDAHDPEIVFSWKDEPASRREQRPERGLVGPPGKYDVLARDAFEGPALAPFAYYEKAQPEVVESAHRDIGAFVRGEPSDEEPEVATFVVRDE